MRIKLLVSVLQMDFTSAHQTNASTVAQLIQITIVMVKLVSANLHLFITHSNTPVSAQIVAFTSMDKLTDAPIHAQICQFTIKSQILVFVMIL